MLKFFKYFVLVMFVIFLVTGIVIYIGANYGDSRAINEKERTLISSIYGNEINLDKVRLVFDTIYSKDSTKVLGNTVHINTKQFRLYFVETTEDWLDSFSYKYILIHELAHVWQYQTKGWVYIPKSLIAQGVAWIKTGSKDNAYRWQDRLSEGKRWDELNPEEQAQAISDYFYYREIGNQASSEQLNLKKRLECFMPFLIDSLCESQG